MDEPAALIYCPFRALLHLPSWADRRRTFERVAAALRPGGRFAWEAFAFDHRTAARDDVYCLEISLFPLTNLAESKEANNGTARDAVADSGSRSR